MMNYNSQFNIKKKKTYLNVFNSSNLNLQKLNMSYQTTIKVM